MRVDTRAIIIDDETSSILNLKIVCSRLGIEIVDSTTNPLQTKELLEKHQPDLLFLDVQMPEMDGIEVLHNVAKMDWNGKVIMVTAHNNYMLEAFRNNAFDFIVKPVSLSELRLVVERVNDQKNSQLQKEKIKDLTNILKKRIKIRSTYENYYLNPSDIFFCEADGKYTIVHKTDGEKLMTSVNLGSMEDILPGTDFCRINKSYIANCNYLVKSDRKAKTCLLSTHGMERELQYSKTYTKHLENFF